MSPAALDTCETEVLPSTPNLTIVQLENAKALALQAVAEAVPCPPGPLQDYLAEEGQLRNQGTLRCVKYLLDKLLLAEQRAFMILC
jgi:hypothetical protein